MSIPLLCIPCKDKRVALAIWYNMYMNTNINKILFVIFAILIVGGISYMAYTSPHSTEPVFCTADAKMCPDGSYVGRTGPRCEFAACPGASNESLKTYTDAETGATFEYPETLSTTYISTTDWPPLLQIVDGTYECREAGREIDRAGKTEKKVINGRNYCVTTVTEGAAGSIYTMQAYAFPKGNNQVAILTFGLRATQCGNYDNPQKSACESERAAFSMDAIMDQIATSLTLK